MDVESAASRDTPHVVTATVAALGYRHMGCAGANSNLITLFACAAYSEGAAANRIESTSEMTKRQQYSAGTSASAVGAHN